MKIIEQIHRQYKIHRIVQNIDRLIIYQQKMLEEMIKDKPNFTQYLYLINPDYSDAFINIIAKRKMLITRLTQVRNNLKEKNYANAIATTKIANILTQEIENDWDDIRKKLKIFYNAMSTLNQFPNNDQTGDTHEKMPEMWK